MPRPKVTDEDRREVFPLRLKKAHAARLKELARAFGLSPGEWVEAQVEPYMPVERKGRA